MAALENHHGKYQSDLRGNSGRKECKSKWENEPDEAIDAWQGMKLFAISNACKKEWTIKGERPDERRGYDRKRSLSPNGRRADIRSDVATVVLPWVSWLSVGLSISEFPSSNPP